MLNITVDYTPNQDDNDIILEGLIKSYEKIVGERDKSFSIFLKDESGNILGGIRAFFDTQSIYIDLMWIVENLRNQGYGKQLLDAAEKEGVRNGCLFSTVDTWDFQAEEFYQKTGYRRIGEIKNYWFDHSRIFLRKKLK